MHKRSILFAALTATTGALALTLTPRPAAAWPPFLTDWQTVYPASTTDDNVIAGLGMGCAVCHFHPTGGTGWNAYGWEVRKKFYAGYAIQDAIIEAGKWDSEPNPASWSNALEIAAGTQPGWTPGANNMYYDDSMTLTGQSAPAITGDFDPLTPSPMISMCDAGVGSVITCPCGNPQDGLNRGCENSATTTGAAMTAAGAASLAADTLVFSTGGERATALSILLQGKAFSSTGFVYGQGVRCVNTALKRLFKKNASNGSVTLPDFGAGNPTVSAQSAAKGDTILFGETRYYLVYYRDGVVLGGCPVTSSFNSTQTGEVYWNP